MGVLPDKLGLGVYEELEGQTLFIYLKETPDTFFRPYIALSWFKYIRTYTVADWATNPRTVKYHDCEHLLQAVAKVHEIINSIEEKFDEDLQTRTAR